MKFKYHISHFLRSIRMLHLSSYIIRSNHSKRKEDKVMTFVWKVNGIGMDEAVMIKTDGENATQALLKARKEANKRGLQWDYIELSI